MSSIASVAGSAMICDGRAQKCSDYEIVRAWFIFFFMEWWKKFFKLSTRTNLFNFFFFLNHFLSLPKGIEGYLSSPRSRNFRYNGSISRKRFAQISSHWKAHSWNMGRTQWLLWRAWTNNQQRQIHQFPTLHLQQEWNPKLFFPCMSFDGIRCWSYSSPFSLQLGWISCK